MKRNFRLSRPFLPIEQWLAISIVVILLAGWEIFSRTGLISPIFFPAPSLIIRTMFQLTVNGKLELNLLATLNRVFIGFALGGSVGLILGLTMGWSHKLHSFFDPFIASIHPVPKIAVFPLIMIIFGIGEFSKVVVVSLAVFFPMLINSMAGTTQINPVHFHVAKNYGASPIKVFISVVLPGSLPMVLAGARLAINAALLITITIELISTQDGLGAMIWLAWETFRVEELYVSIMVVAILGIGFNFLLQLISGRLVPWQPKRNRQ
jgi:ABC-type nitrate/sulfonate/bicarbonate transport system permease component